MSHSSSASAAPIGPLSSDAPATTYGARAPGASFSARNRDVDIRVQTTPDAIGGWLNGLLGMLIFSGSLPATRVALAGFSPTFLTFSRASLAGVLALAALWLTRSRRPTVAQWTALAAVALGAVVGFPLFTGIALQSITSAQALVFIGLLPLSTALFGVLRTSERPSRWFWIYSVFGAAIIVGYALHQMIGHAPASPRASPASAAVLLGQMMMLLAIIVCGYAYAEGARLARDLGGWQVICWALVLALPFMLMAGWFDRPWSSGPLFDTIGLPGLHAHRTSSAPPTFLHWVSSVPVGAWLGLAYVSLFSMLIGFFFWYRGVSMGGVAAVGQLQLLQPFVGLLLAGVVLGETIKPSMLFVSAAVVGCVAMARRTTARKRGST